MMNVKEYFYKKLTAQYFLGTAGDDIVIKLSNPVTAGESARRNNQLQFILSLAKLI